MKNLLVIALILTFTAFIVSCDEENGTETVTVTDTVAVDNSIEILVETNISGDVTWSSDSVYILGARVTVLDGATLTIEAGTIVKGQAGTGSNATALLVARGGMLMAEGTASAPIIFTSIADEIMPADVQAGNFGSPNLDPDIQGLWGGVIVLGNARISAQNDNDQDVTELQIEGIPTSDTNGLYGGEDDSDNSGVINYISIRHGGSNIGEGNEINGLTLGGVGTGTSINGVEIVANQDDGIEWFGGTVSATNVLIWNNGDDAVDTDQAWAGTVDNGIIVSAGDSPFELDGPEGNYTGAGHTITNFSVYAMGNGAEELIDVDDNTDVNISNIFFFGINELNTISSDYPEYAANTDGYSITSIEAVIPSELTVDGIFGDLASEVSTVSGVNAATVGADATQFGFTWASQSDAGLSAVGL